MLSSLVSAVSATCGPSVSLLSPSQRTVAEFWLEKSRWRGCALLSPGLKDWETPDPPLVNPSPYPWRDPSFRRPPEPERKAGDPGTEMSGSAWAGAFLKGEGETGALRGSGKNMTLIHSWLMLVKGKRAHIKQHSQPLNQISCLGCVSHLPQIFIWHWQVDPMVDSLEAISEVCQSFVRPCHWLNPVFTQRGVAVRLGDHILTPAHHWLIHCMRLKPAHLLSSTNQIPLREEEIFSSAANNTASAALTMAGAEINYSNVITMAQVVEPVSH